MTDGGNGGGEQKDQPAELIELQREVHIEPEPSVVQRASLPIDREDSREVHRGSEEHGRFLHALCLRGQKKQQHGEDRRAEDDHHKL
jgi:hypothetical protein